MVNMASISNAPDTPAAADRAPSPIQYAPAQPGADDHIESAGTQINFDNMKAKQRRFDPMSEMKASSSFCPQLLEEISALDDHLFSSLKIVEHDNDHSSVNTVDMLQSLLLRCPSDDLASQAAFCCAASGSRMLVLTVSLLVGPTTS